LENNPLEPLEELQEILDLQWDRLRCKERIERLLRQIRHELNPKKFPTSITFHQENPMNPTQAGQSQVFTGTLQPAGASYPSDTAFTLTSNDPAVSPTLDSTGLIVSVTYPSGWVESTTTPLAFAYEASSASTGGSLSAVITPSAPPAAFPTGVTFAQTT
jgi:hypothetical protein